jgi:hypothetical protein
MPPNPLEIHQSLKGLQSGTIGAEKLNALRDKFCEALALS